MLEPEDVVAASKAILLRHPGDDNAIQDWIIKGFTKQTLQRAFLESKEFLLQQNRQNIIEYKLKNFNDKEAQLENLKKLNLLPIDRYIDSQFSLSDSERKLFTSISNSLSLRVIVVIGDEKADQCARLFSNSSNDNPLIVISNCPEYQGLNRAANKSSPSFVRLPVHFECMIGLLSYLRIIPDLIIISANSSSIAPLAFELGHEHTIILIEKNNINSAALAELERIVPPHMGEIIYTDNFISVTNMWFPLPIAYMEESAKDTYRLHCAMAIVAIVKDEAEMIEKMLASASNLASLVVLADTGSTDGTTDIARAACEAMGIPIKVITVEFRTFSQARNAALDAVPGSIDWVLMLDADEYIVDADKPKIIDLMQRGDCDAWSLPRYNFMSRHDNSQLLAYPDRQARLFRNKQNSHIRYVNPVHETLSGYDKMGSAPSNLSSFDLGTGGPHIHHIGMFKSDLKAATRARQNDLLAETTQTID